MGGIGTLLVVATPDADVLAPGLIPVSALVSLEESPILFKDEEQRVLLMLRMRHVRHQDVLTGELNICVRRVSKDVFPPKVSLLPTTNGAPAIAQYIRNCENILCKEKIWCILEEMEVDRAQDPNTSTLLPR